MVNTTSMEQMTKYYWGMLSARAAAAGTTTTTSLRSWPPPAHGSGGDPSWEELAFARDAAGNLGGCVWPPRSYTCTFCGREFRSAQALGGHMNVHRRDRARLRQCASLDHHDVVQVQDAHQQQSIAPQADHLQHQLRQLQEAPLFRAKAVLLSGPKSTNCDHQACTTTSPSYISTIIKESKNKIPGWKEEALERYEEEEEETMAERRKRRRVHQPPEAVLPFFLHLPPVPCDRVEHDAKLVLDFPNHKQGCFFF
ncbi:uncharacterized protein LOC133891071 [Phragmites australis]|uniref:uncharacterized protein LOC133891071 n=1 Tax=Phragmites australis TaxID=29695 RepID=UPI002D77E323|nr:uncharacterized protein LOC133891071 [Phragmites australis]